MKYFLILLIGIIIIIVVFNYRKVDNPVETTVYPSPTTIVEVNPNLSSGYLLERKIASDKLTLINNTNTKLTSDVLMKNNDCVYGINGGFYGTDDKPIGWMVVGNELVSRAKESELFNGYIVIDNAEGFNIYDLEFEGTPKFGLQTGPLLISNGQPWKLDLTRDKPARRMIMGIASDGIFLMAIFNGEAETTGPQLMDLPNWVVKIAEKEKLEIETAVNLDGGGASAIYTSKGNLIESNPVGSWWCINK